LHQERWRHSRDVEDHLLLERIQFTGGLSRKGQASFRTRRQRHSHTRRRYEWWTRYTSMAATNGRTTLRLSNAEWLFRCGRELGKHWWAARADELRARIGQQSHSGHTSEPGKAHRQHGGNE